MSSRAAELARLCDEVGSAFETASADEVRGFEARLAALAGGDIGDDPAALRRALDATRRLMARVETARADVADRLDRLGAGRHARRTYGSSSTPRPRAVDAHA